MDAHFESTGANSDPLSAPSRDRVLLSDKLLAGHRHFVADMASAGS